MIVTILSIGILGIFLIILTIVNKIMIFVNNLLFTMFKILLPISILSSTVYFLKDYLISYFDIENELILVLLSSDNLDILSGLLTLLYMIFVMKRKTNSIMTKIVLILLLVPIVLYLLDVPIEFITNIFGYSFNEYVYEYSIEIIKILCPINLNYVSTNLDKTYHILNDTYNNLFIY